MYVKKMCIYIRDRSVYIDMSHMTSMMTSVYCSYTADVEKGAEKGPYTSVCLMQTR